jgi:hypothetical protein
MGQMKMSQFRIVSEDDERYSVEPLVELAVGFRVARGYREESFYAAVVLC